MKKPRPHLQQASSWCMLFSGLSIVSFIFIIFFVIVNNEDLKKNPKITTIVPFKPPVELPSPSTKPKAKSKSAPPTHVVESSLHRIGNRDVNKECPNRIKPLERYTLPPFKKKNGSFDMHFIHIPKCGGTSMTAILRQVSCEMDPVRNNDCCTNPGFCDWHAVQRCASIRGCINHIPQRPWIFKTPPSITLLREPQSRIISAWFYRGHTPNLDFFQVRPEFKEIHDGKRPKVTFPEYIEMPEYQNIQTRMLGADEFPYRNVTITQDIFCRAVEAIDNIYFVGIQEAYDISVKVLLRELNISLDIKILKERDNSNQNILAQKQELKSNFRLMARYRELNKIDYDLYQLGVNKFCATVSKYPDLMSQLKKEGKVKCPV